jgi:hypothetical protein
MGGSILVQQVLVSGSEKIALSQLRMETWKRLGSVLLSMTKTYAAPFAILLGLALAGLALNLSIKRP